MNALLPIPAIPAAEVLDSAIYRLGLALNQRGLMPARAILEIEDALVLLRQLRAAQEPAQ